MTARTGGRYPLVVFDWDGTLVDSTTIIATCLQRACADLGVGVPDDTMARYIIGMGVREGLELAVPDLPVERHRELSLRYRHHFLATEAEVTLFPGARALLEELRAAGHCLAVATGKSRRGLERAMEQLDLGELFSVTRCADEGAPKPDPDMLRVVMRVAGAGPHETVMIGDTTHDIAMARSAGVAAVGVSYGAHSPERLRAAADIPVLDSIAELRAFLLEP